MICLRLDLLLGVWIRKYVFNYVENGIDYCKMLLLAYFDICEKDVYYCCENPRHQVDFFFECDKHVHFKGTVHGATDIFTEFTNRTSWTISDMFAKAWWDSLQGIHLQGRKHD